MFTVYLFYAGDISQSVRDLLLLSGFYVNLKSATIIQYTIKGRFMNR